VPWAALAEFIAFFVQPPQPFVGRVMSMIQWGARNCVAEAMKVFQSSRDSGEKSFVPVGQLFLSLERYTSKQFSHFKTVLAEYRPLSSTFLQVHPVGLPAFGAVVYAMAWQ